MIDPNEAPEGFVAVGLYRNKGNVCSGCAFYKDNECQMTDSLCFPAWRKDGEHVIFIHREKANIIDFAKAKAEINQLPKSNLAEFSAIGELAEARAEAAKWKLAHDQVCRKFADCENARDENARLWEESQAKLKRWQDIAAQYSQEREHNANEALRWKAECRDLTDLVAKLKGQPPRRWNLSLGGGETTKPNEPNKTT